MSVVKAAFSKAVINDLWSTPLGWEYEGYHDDVEARCAYFSCPDGRLLLVALDIGILSRRRDRTLRLEISKRLNLNPDEILVHCTQAHNAVPYDLVHLDEVAERIAESTSPAMDEAEEAEMAFIYADVGSKFSVNRRKYVSDDLGVCTFWDCYRRDGDRADASHLVEALRRALLSPEPSNIYWLEREKIPLSGGMPRAEGLSPIWYDRPVDPLVQLLVFRSLDGRPLGSIIRFSTHVQTAVFPLKRDKVYTADFPHYTRIRLEEALGGVSIFTSGPAGDVVPLVEEWTWREVERYGNDLAEVVLREFERCRPAFSPVTRLDVRSVEVELPVREDMPTNVEEAKMREAIIRREINSASALGAPLRQIKRMADLLDHYCWSPNKLGRWNYLDPEEARRRRVTVRLTGVRLNDVVILGMPGEAVCETSIWLRANSMGARLVTLYDCNGDIGYIPEARDYVHGGYEVACSIVAPEGETRLREGAMRLIRDLIQGG